MKRTQMIASLTKRDIDIMTILWNSPKPMTASEITSADPSLTVNTTQAVLRRLLKNEFVAIDSIVYSRTVLCRSFRPTLSQEEFALARLSNEYRKFEGVISKASFLSTLLDANSDKEQTQKDLEQLRKLMDDYTKKIAGDRLPADQNDSEGKTK